VTTSSRHSERSRDCNAAIEDGEARLSIPMRNLGFFRGILRLRCAPLGMTVNQ
jgi:hypothetical protein